MKTKVFRESDEARLQKKMNDWLYVSMVKPGDVKFITQSESFGVITVTYHYVVTNMGEKLL